MEDRSKKHVGWLAITVILISATVADLISLIPLAGSITVLLFWGCVSWYLYKKGYGLISGKRLATGLLMISAEWIPAVQELPATIVGTIVLIFLLRLEEKTGISATAVISAGKLPLNKGGIRKPNVTAPPLNNMGSRGPRSNIKPLSGTSPRPQEWETSLSE